MKAIASRWERVRQPSLQWRSATSVLVAFVAVWIVLTGYAWVENDRAVARDQPMRRFSEAVHRPLERLSDPGQARAAVVTTVEWINERRSQGERFPVGVDAELLDASGQRVLASPRLAHISDAAWARSERMELDGRAYRLHEVRGPRWTLRIAEPVRTTERFLAYNAASILEYLLLAVPIVLLSVWWSVRRGLRPLEQFAGALQQRGQGDLSPVAHPVRHRELVPLKDALDALLAQLRMKLERERAFVQDAAHEIRTPLALVGTQAHVLAHAPDAAERERAQELLNQAIARASHVAQQLLLLATLDAPSREAPRHVDVAQAVRGLLAQLAPLAMARGIELSLDAPDHLWATVDEPALVSIVGNLVDNAIRYGRAGGSVVVVLAQAGQGLQLQVRDDGPGIASAERPHVFERFYRAPGQQPAGSGLGLAIVRQAVSRAGGTVGFCDGLGGQGVGFALTLPAT